MAKRFTDTEKWNDTWFAELTDKNKLFWLYYIDCCDVAGIWKESFRLFFHATGNKFTHDDILKSFNDRIFLIRDGIYFCPKFIKFQNFQFYESGLTDIKNGAHRGIIKALKYYDILDNISSYGILQTKGYQSLSSGLPKSTLRDTVGLGNTTGIGTSISIGTGTINTVNTANTVPIKPIISDGADESQYTFRPYPSKNVLRGSIKRDELTIVDEIKKVNEN